MGVCLKIVYPLNPMVLLIIIPIKWLFHGNINPTFSGPNPWSFTWDDPHQRPAGNVWRHQWSRISWWVPVDTSLLWTALWVFDVWCVTGWWYAYPSEKYEIQLGLWHSQYMESHKIHVPNHQPGDYVSLLVRLCVTLCDCLSLFQPILGNMCGLLLTSAYNSEKSKWLYSEKTAGL